MTFVSNPYALGHLLLRAGVAFAFLYPPIAALYDPVAWVGYFPAFVDRVPADALLLLHAFGALEVVLALWLLWGRALRFPAILSALILFAIVIVNPQEFPILFRDVSIALAALSLAVLPEPQRIA